MTKSKPKVDLTQGPIFVRIFLFVIPIILTGVLQVAYNMADNIVVGQFSGDPDALAAVGSTSSLTTLIVNVMISFAAGASAVIAQFYGAKNEQEVSKSVHTAMLFSVIGGIIFMAVGLVVARPMLVLMGTKADILDKAILYMSIICLGIPASAIYNFGAAVLRSSGDSKTSLYILAASGIINVAFNLVFVLVFGMAVDGVATATIISQYISAVAVVIVLFKRKGEAYALSLKKLKIEMRLLGRILRFGLPIAIQSSLFSISNIVVSSAVNTFPKTTVSAKTIAFNVEGITYTAMNSFSHAAITFVGQNYGAKKHRRINKIFLYLILQVTAVGILVAQTEILFGRQLASLYIDAADPNKEIIINTVLEIFNVMLSVYFLCGIMEVISSALKAIGYSVTSMVASLTGLALRISWILFVTPKMHTIFGLFISYAISWIATILLLGGCCIYVWRKQGIWKGAKEEKLLEKNEKILELK